MTMDASAVDMDTEGTDNRLTIEEKGGEGGEGGGKEAMEDEEQEAENSTTGTGSRVPGDVSSGTDEAVATVTAATAAVTAAGGETVTPTKKSSDSSSSSTLIPGAAASASTPAKKKKPPPVPPVEPPAVWLARLAEAMEQVPLPEKAAYLQALEQCPHLVVSESNPLAFLRVEDYKTWEAAQRLAGYWETRLDIFGSQRAFLPMMDLTGRGALDAEAIRAVQTGYNVFLPNDAHGRPVVCLDSSLAVQTAGNHSNEKSCFSENAILQSSYYVRNVIAQQEMAQTEGYIGLVVFNEAFGKMSKSLAFQRLTDALKKFPLRVRAIYILKIIPPPKGGKNDSSGRAAPALLKNAVRSATQVLDQNVGHQLNPIVAKSNAELLRKLEVYGLSASGLPKSIGGTWDYSNFFKWLGARIGAGAGGATPMDTETSLLDTKPAAVERMDTSITTPSPPPPEMAAAHNDSTYGEQETDEDAVISNSNHSNNMDELRAMTLEAFDYMDDFEKAAYDEAMEKCPSLVASESCPMRFLVCEGNDPWAAARRLASYWTHRKKIFGPQRAFLPMNQTCAGGALTAEDVRLVQCGYNTILPQTATAASAAAVTTSVAAASKADENDDEERQQPGRSVLLVDRSKVPDDASPMTMLRAVFYALQVLSENEVSQRQGYLCLVLDSHASHSKPLCAAVVQDGNELFETAMPIRSADIHILCPLWLSEEQGSSPEQQEQLEQRTQPSPEKAAKTSSGWMDMMVQQKPTVHTSRTPQDLVSALESMGLHQEHLPAELGGGCTEADLAQWHVGRIKIERERQSSIAKPLAETMDRTTDESNETVKEQNIVDLVQRAIDRIPESQKADYLLAKEQVPDLVAQETPLMRFVKNDDYDATAVASRLVAYWANRRSLFAEKAFLPMNLTGNGALSETEVALVTSGSIVALPAHSQGRSVLFVNKKRMGQIVEPGSAQLQWRIFFYWMHVVAENPISQSNGFSLIMLWGPPFDLQANYKFEMELLAEAIPARLFAHRVVCLSQDLPYVFPRLIPSLKSSVVEKTFVHVGETRGEICDGLCRLGFLRANIPVDVGGDWEYQKQFPTWLMYRKNVELVYQQEFTSVHANIEHLLSMCADRLKSHKSRHTLVARVERAEMRKKSLTVLGDVINILPDASKAAYLEAMERIPRLVARESDSVQFLRAEGYDPWAAAKRLTAYWQKRKVVFKEKAFLPMNQSGEGALMKSDISLLTTGYCCLLPDDSKGRPVLCIDESRRKTTRVENRSRVCFYLGSVMAENEIAQEDGCVVFVVLSKMPSDGSVEPLFELAESVLPLSIAEVHVVLTPKSKVDATALSSWVLQKYGKKATTHTGKSKADLVARMVSRGFEEDSLPETIGGTWSYAQFAQWIEIRTRLEWELPLGLAQKSAGGSIASRPRVRSMAELTEEEKVERKRRMNLLHSRRKREKARVEIDVLKKQVAELEELNRSAEEDNARLESLLRESNSVVASLQEEQNVNPPAGAPVAQPVFSRAAPARLEPPTPSESRTEPRHSPGRMDEQQHQHQHHQSLESLELQREQLLLQLSALQDQKAAFDQPQYNQHQHQANTGLGRQVNNQTYLLQQLCRDIPDNSTSLSSFPTRAPPTTGLALAGLTQQFQWPTLSNHALSERASLGNSFHQQPQQQQHSLGFPFQQQHQQHQQAGGALGLSMQQANTAFGRALQQQQQQPTTGDVLGGLSLPQQLAAISALGSLSLQQQQEQQQQDDALRLLRQHLTAAELAALCNVGQQQQQQQTVDPFILGLALQQRQQQQQQQQQLQQQHASLPPNFAFPGAGLPADAVSSSDAEQLILQYLASQQQQQQPPRDGREQDDRWNPASAGRRPF